MRESGDDGHAGDGRITMAFVGDAMITRGLRPFREPDFLGVRQLLRRCSVRFANAEMLFHDYEDAPTYNSRTWMRCDPRLVRDLQWLGINLVSCANNHALDYGESGVVRNIEHLDRAGLAHAGSGESYASAVAPTYKDTAQGRVALVAATTSARPHGRAGEQRRDVKGRPGVNLVRWINEWSVDDEALAALARIARELAWQQKVPAWWGDAFGVGQRATDGEVYLADRNGLGVGSEDPAARFVRGDGFGRGSRVHRLDLERNVASVREARKMADWVVYSLHSHEGGETDSEPAEHVRVLAHAVVDAGADVVIGHGPHCDRGIEVYRGKPIFYSLGNFIMQNDTVERLPADAMALWRLGPESSAADLYDARAATAGGESDWGLNGRSAVAEVQFDEGKLSSIRLHPIEVGYRLPRSQRGRPMLAHGTDAEECLMRFRTLSEPLRTSIEIHGEEAVVRV